MEGVTLTFLESDDNACCDGPEPIIRVMRTARTGLATIRESESSSMRDDALDIERVRRSDSAAASTALGTSAIASIAGASSLGVNGSGGDG